MLVPVVVALSLWVPACGDGRPAFCGPLEERADLDGLATALTEGDLATASAEAGSLRELAAGAPAEIRGDLVALADAVVDVVDLIEQQDDPESNTGDLERRRAALDRDLSGLGQRSDRVERWALRRCGVRLG